MFACLVRAFCNYDADPADRSEPGDVQQRPDKRFLHELTVDATVPRATLRVGRDRLDSIRAAALERVAEALPGAGRGPAIPAQIVQVSERRPA